MSSEDGRSKWTEVKALMNVPSMAVGASLSNCLRHSPREFIHSMSYYKFASKLIGTDRRVLDIGCGEGLGTWLLAVECGFAEGIDTDDELIQIARANFPDQRIAFRCTDLFSGPGMGWSGIVCIDHPEHLRPETAERFVALLWDRLTEDGVAVVGGLESAPETCRATTDSSSRVEKLLNRFFSHVFVFGTHEDVIQMGFLPMSPYYLVVACGKREQPYS